MRNMLIYWKMLQSPEKNLGPAATLNTSFVSIVLFCCLPLQIQENITCAKSKQKRAYDKKMAQDVRVFHFTEGDRVLRRNMVKANTKGNSYKKNFSMRWQPVVQTSNIII